MMFLSKLNISILIFILCCSCATNVSHWDKVNKNNTMSIFFDASGNLYPENYSICDFGLCDYEYNIDEDKLEILLPEADEVKLKTNISGFYKGENKKFICDSIEYKDVDIEGYCTENIWRVKKDKALKLKATRIFNRIKNKKKLYILLHGFNVDDANSTYDLLRSKISDKLTNKNSAYFLDVHWDGYSCSYQPLRCWKEAQSSGYLVGFNLRVLFNHLNQLFSEYGKELDISLVSHSAGAFVITSFIGDPSYAYPLLFDNNIFVDTNKNIKNNGTYDEWFFYKSHKNDQAGDYKIVNFDTLKVVMFAPAMPSSTLMGCSDDEVEYLGVRNSNAKIIVTQNECDPAINKVIGVSSRLGATGLGRLPYDSFDKGEYCNLVCHFNNGRYQGDRPEVYAIEIDTNCSHDAKKYFDYKKSELIFNFLANNDFLLEEDDFYGPSNCNCVGKKKEYSDKKCHS